jgi:hypothetical protein
MILHDHRIRITGVYTKRFVPSLFRRVMHRYDGT